MYVARKKVRYKQPFFYHNTNKIVYYPFIISFSWFFCILCSVSDYTCILYIGRLLVYDWIFLNWYTSPLQQQQLHVLIFFFFLLFHIQQLFTYCMLILDSQYQIYKGAFFFPYYLTIWMDLCVSCMHLLLYWMISHFIVFGFGFGSNDNYCVCSCVISSNMLYHCYIRFMFHGWSSYRQSKKIGIQ